VDAGGRPPSTRARRPDRRQFNGYVAVDTLHVNGKLTLGENIADLVGLAVAYAALQKALGGPPAPVHRRLFRGRASASSCRGPASGAASSGPRRRASASPHDSHAPARWRVNGPLSNLPEFTRAFGCRSGDAMVRDEKLQVRICV
jgi:putative endopeptidase